MLQKKIKLQFHILNLQYFLIMTIYLQSSWTLSQVRKVLNIHENSLGVVSVDSPTPQKKNLDEMVYYTKKLS